MCRELSKYPDCEDGGKYIGLIERHSTTTRIVIVDFLPGGPNARRTCVEFFPDGEYQEELFRQAERLDSSIEHLGTWHSHHCNGLQTLSTGDVKGYFKTVGKRNYRPDFFLASLVTRVPQDPEEDCWVSHYLFVRKAHNYYDATSAVKLVDVTNPWQGITGHIGLPDNAQSRKTMFVDADLKWWYESDVGRQTLAEDRKLFIEKFGHQIVAKRTKGRIMFTGTCSSGVQITIAYPATVGDKSVNISVGRDEREIVKVSCEIDFRRVAMEGTFRIAELLESSSGH